MAKITLQRTLLVGLGDAAGQTAAAFLVEMDELFGPVGVIRAVVVAAEAVERPDSLPLSYLRPGENGALPPELKPAVAAGLAEISQLHHLAALKRQGVSLRADELLVIVVADMAEAWVRAALPPLCQNLRAMVNPVLAPHLATLGVLLWSTAAPLPVLDSAERFQPDLAALATAFDRGCYVAGLTNEAGLIVGDPQMLVQQMAAFLALPVCLARQEGGLIVPATGWTTPVTYVGLAKRRWPGPALVETLVRRWSRTMLVDLIIQPPARGPTADPAESGRRQAQRALVELKLTPPQLLEGLANEMPAAPGRLGELVPETPWPWLLRTAFESLEQVAPPWQEAWLKNSRQLDDVLAALRAGWPEQVESYLSHGLHHHRTRAVLFVQARIAAVTELLTAFADGVEDRLAESEAALAQIDQRLGRTAERLAEQLDRLPRHPMALALRWGPRPWRWPAAYGICRQAQSDLRQVAQLQQARLQSWQQISLLEALLPFYRELTAQWLRLTRPWAEGCRHVSQAITMLGTDGEDDLEISEPWSAAVVDDRQQTLEAETTAAVWAEAGSLVAWITGAGSPEALLDRLRRPMLRRLTSIWQRPADTILAEHLPEVEAQLAFLQRLIKEATPFWPFDEAALAEPDRMQVTSQIVLLLPQGERSPLGQAARQIKPLPALWPSLRPDQIAVATLRHVPVGTAIK